MFGLAKRGILGINARNLDVIAESNARKHYPAADSKLITKRLAQSVGINVPRLINVIESQYQVKSAVTAIESDVPCVFKPDHGSGGGGILIIQDVLPIGYKKPSGLVTDAQEVRFHCQNILSGMYSLGNQPDAVLIEKAVEFDPVFNDIAFQGVPDIRIVVHHGVPVMGMLRLPTVTSDGKANLHMGGIGVGVDMEKGETTLAVQFNRYVKRHPETGHLLAGHTIPYWQQMLEMAVKMQEVSGLGYVGVDVVLDKHEGPMILEINARPGISIQIANGMGLKSKLSGPGN